MTMKKSSLVIYGGVGRSVLDDLSVLDADTMCWSQITTSANSANDRPGKLLGHAAVCVGNRCVLKVTGNVHLMTFLVHYLCNPDSGFALLMSSGYLL